MPATRQTSAVRKRSMLKALEKSLGVVTTAAKSAGIDRQTHYNWMEKDPKYKAAVESISDIALDFAESQLHENMKRGSDAATIFYLKTKGKRRGYVEKTEVEHSGGMKIVWNETKTYDDGEG